MPRVEFTIDTIKRMRNSVRDLCTLQIALQLKNIFAHGIDLAVLVFRNSPNEDVQLAGIVGEIGGDLFADKGSRPIIDLQAAFDGIVIGDGDVVHPSLPQFFIQLFRVRIAVRKIETAKKPFFRTRTVARMNMKIAPAHSYIPRLNLCCAIQSW